MKVRMTMLVLLTAVSVFGAQGKPDNADTWTLWNAGYECQEKAKTARSQGKLDAAVVLLEEARKYYLEVKRSRPDWNQRVIDSRIARVETDLATVKRLLGLPAGASGKADAGKPAAVAAKPEAPAAPAPDVAAVKAAEPARDATVEPETPAIRLLGELRQMTAERDQYRQAVAELSRELESLRLSARANAANVQEIENLLKENRRLEDQISEFKGQVAQMEERLSRPSDQVKALNDQLVAEKLKGETMAKQLEAARQEVTQVKTDSDAAYRERNRLRADAESMNAGLRAAERELGELRNRRTFDDADRDAARREIDSRDGEIARLKSELTKTTAALDELHKKFSEILADPKLNGLESAGVLADNVKLQEQLLALRNDCDKAASRAAAAEAELVKRDTELTDLRKRDQDHVSSSAVHAEELRIAREDCARAAKKMADAEKENVELKSRVSLLESSVIELTGRADQLKKQLESGSNSVQNLIGLNARIDDLAGKLAAASSDRDRFERDFNDRDARLKTASKELDGLRTECADLTVSVNELKAAAKRAADLEAANAELAKRGDELASALAVSKKEIEKRDAEKRIAAEGLEALPGLRRRLAETQQRNQKLASDLEGSKIAAAKIQMEAAKHYDALKTHLDALSEQNRKLRAMLRGVDTSGFALPEISESELAAMPVPATGNAEMAKLLAAAAAADTPELALFNLRKAVELSPDNPDAAADLGLLEYSSGDRERAEKLLSFALGTYPEDPALAAAYAELMIGRERFGNALEVLEKPLAVNPSDPVLNRVKAAALWRSGEPGRAEAILRPLADASPVRADASFELAQLIARNFGGRLGEAADLYRQSIALGHAADPYLEKALASELSEDNETAGFLYATAAEAENAGNWDSAAWFYREIRDLEPARNLPKLKLARALLKQREKGAALETLSQLSNSDREPDEPAWNELTAAAAGDSDLLQKISALRSGGAAKP